MVELETGFDRLYRVLQNLLYETKLIYKTSGRCRGAFMMLEAQTFDYVVKDEDGEILGEYSSTNEPPMKGDMIDLSLVYFPLLI